MRELTRDNMITTTELLLFDILQELKKQYDAIPVPTMTLVTEPKPDGVYCKYCGGTHPNYGYMAACKKKYDAKGGK